jgi:hypothetical protein
VDPLRCGSRSPSRSSGRGCGALGHRSGSRRRGMPSVGSSTQGRSSNGTYPLPVVAHCPTQVRGQSGPARLSRGPALRRTGHQPRAPGSRCGPWTSAYTRFCARDGEQDRAAARNEAKLGRGVEVWKTASADLARRPAPVQASETAYRARLHRAVDGRMARHIGGCRPRRRSRSARAPSSARCRTTSAPPATLMTSRRVVSQVNLRAVAELGLSLAVDVARGRGR